jgi:hypothetical protein
VARAAVQVIAYQDHAAVVVLEFFGFDEINFLGFHAIAGAAELD